MNEKKIIINHNSSEIRAALIENGKLIELFIERRTTHSIVGNIYKAIVTRVLPGMNSAFLDIGDQRSAFLFGGDVIDTNKPIPERIDEENDILSDNIKANEVTIPIEKNLREGQQVYVQVSKDPLGSKGPRVTGNLTIAGRYLVLTPYSSHIGISRRIELEEERLRLKKLLESILPKDIGVIVRTAARGATKEELINDINFLKQTWSNIRKSMPLAKAPSLLHSDLDLTNKIIRDLYEDSINSIVVDDEEVYKSLQKFLWTNLPTASDALELYNQEKPIFDEFDIEFDIAKALSKRVDLPSGGYLIIEQTEALTSIDVNTGKFVGKANAQETILKTNLEAINAICEQLRVRNIGGIIILDFIDMESLINRDLIYDQLLEALKADRARTNILRISELGLIQMTRKRTSDSLERSITVPCPHCNGSGIVRSIQTEAYDLLREIQRISLQTHQKSIKVRVRSDIKDWILNQEKDLYKKLIIEKNLEVEFLPNQLDIELLREPAFEVFA
ncbi:MAG: Rne/Rng family ribonuclease [Bdellovibrionota bacterium]